jgi:hypothetical protein
LYAIEKASYLNSGLSERAAGQVAAHFANRFAGTLPPEAMNKAATRFLNVALFSRMFTLGNLGVLKDIVVGLPPEIRATILQEGGELMLKAAQSNARRTALGSVAVDIGLALAVNGVVQAALSGEDMADGLKKRMGALMDKVAASPMQLLHLFDNLHSLTPNAMNEAGKENRILLGVDKHGTAQYARLPFGKIGEELEGYMTNMLHMFNNKESTFVKPLQEIALNDQGFGRHVWDDKEALMTVKNIGKCIGHFVAAQIPYDTVVAAWDVASGHGDEMDVKKVVGPLLGVTFSQGAKGGPVAGEMYKAERDFAQRKMNAMPQVKRSLKLGDEQEAMRILKQEVGMSDGEATKTMNRLSNDAPAVGKNTMKRFNKHATDEQKAKVQEMREVGF